MRVACPPRIRGACLRIPLKAPAPRTPPPCPTRRLVAAHDSRPGRNVGPAPAADSSPENPEKLPFKAFPFVRLSPGELARLDGAHRPLALVAASSFLLTSALQVTVSEPLPPAAPAALGAAIGAAYVALNWAQMKAAWRSPRDPLRVVITGGSKGLGRALSREFLRAGDRVVVACRRQAEADAAAAQLAEEAGAAPGAAVGVACDVGDPESVAALAAAAAAALGGIDVWVNNAGASGGFRPFLDLDYADLERIVRTNLLGSLLGMRAAAAVMAAQPHGGHLFNVEGAGSGGGPTPNYAAYGATKAAIAQLARTMAAEGGGAAAAGAGIRFHTVQPGMVLTDLLLEGATPGSKLAFNVMCEHPETVAAWLAPRMRAAAAAGAPSGRRIRYLTPGRIAVKLATAPLRVRNRFFDAEGRALFEGEEARVAAARRAAAAPSGVGLAWAYSASLAAAYLVLAADAAAKALPPH